MLILPQGYFVGGGGDRGGGIPAQKSEKSYIFGGRVSPQICLAFPSGKYQG